MSYQKLVTSEEDDTWDVDTYKTVCNSNNSNSFRKRLKSVMYPSSLNANHRFAKSSLSLPNSPKKSNISFFRVSSRNKGDSEERLIMQESEEDNVLEMQG